MLSTCDINPSLELRSGSPFRVVNDIAPKKIATFYDNIKGGLPAVPVQRADAAPKVLFAITELYPFVKTGGLGDVAASLPPALKKQGVDVRYFLPGYPAVKEHLHRKKVVRHFAKLFGQNDVKLLIGTLPNGLKAYVLDVPSFYDRPHPYIDGNKRDWADNDLRFGAFCYVAAHLTEYDTSWVPDIIQGNDWPCGLIPAYRKFNKLSPRTVTITTVHNISYQGLFPATRLDALMLPHEEFRVEGLEFYNQIGFLKAGLFYADHVTAVSQTYAKEITTAAKGCGLEGLLRARGGDLTGILNGIDKQVWNPANDPLIRHNFNHRKLGLRQKNKEAFLSEIGFEGRGQMPLFAFVGRLTPQKGVDLLLESITPLLWDNITLVIMGSGDDRLEEQCRNLVARYPDKVAHVKCEEGLEHRLYAGADAVIVPSHFEPCGLVQLYATRYGALPIVRKTGGLADSVTGERGFVFDPPTAQALRQRIHEAMVLYTRAPRLWRKMQKAAMTEDFGWRKASEKYCDLYEMLIGKSLLQTEWAMSGTVEAA